MANIDRELNQIKTAIYGKDVRGSIHDGIEKINKESEDSKGKANAAHDVMESIMNEGFDNAALESNFEQKLDDKIADLQPEWTGFKDDVTSRLADIAYDMSDLVGDGIADDGVVIETLINTAVTNKVKKIVLPKAEVAYRIDNAMYGLLPDELEVDYSGSELASYVSATNNSFGETGIFNFYGKVSDTVDAAEWMKDFTVGDSVPSIALYSYEKFEMNFGYGSTFRGGKLVTADNNSFSKGDEIVMIADVRPSAPYDAALYEPNIYMVATVIKSDNEHVYVDYYAPTDKLVFDTATANSRVVKVKQKARNITMKNATVTDYAAAGSNVSEQIRTATPFVSAILADTVKFENIHSKNMRGNLFNLTFTRGIELKNCTSKYARHPNTGGTGYLVQHRGCRDIQIDRVVGEECRHVVDFSYSAYAHVNNAEGINGLHADFDLHGLFEHDITFENSVGYVMHGNGISDFACISKNIKFINCDVQMHGASTTDYIENIEFEDCRIKLTRWFYQLSLKVKGGSIEFVLSDSSNSQVNKRNKDVATSISLEDVDLVFLDTPTADHRLFMRDYDSISFENVRYDVSKLSHLDGADIIFEVINVGDFTIDKSKLNSIKLRYRQFNRVLSNLTITNSETVNKNNHAIFIDELTNNKSNIIIDDNTFIYEGAGGSFDAVLISPTKIVNSSITGHIDNNKLVSKNVSDMKLNYENTDSVKLTTQGNIKDNNNVLSFEGSGSKNEVFAKAMKSADLGATGFASGTAFDIIIPLTEDEHFSNESVIVNVSLRGNENKNNRRGLMSRSFSQTINSSYTQIGATLSSFIAIGDSKYDTPSRTLKIPIISNGYGENNLAIFVEIISTARSSREVTFGGVYSVSGHTHRVQHIPTYLSGVGSPEGVIVADSGFNFYRDDGAAKYYVKATGVGKTGWKEITLI